MNRVHSDHSIISSERVEGTNVYSTNGEKIGTVDHMMIDKTSGRVAYVVIAFGGFLGMGEGHHPIPWNALTYDIQKEGYVTGVTENQLKDAPEFSDNSWTDNVWAERVHRHYGVQPFYGL